MTTARADRPGHRRGRVRFAKAAAAAGIRPVFGVDVAVAPITPRPTGQPGRPRTSVRGGAHVMEPPLRITLLAQARAGGPRLCRLVSVVHAEGERRPAGRVLASPCASSPTPAWVVPLGPGSEPVRGRCHVEDHPTRSVNVTVPPRRGLQRPLGRALPDPHPDDNPNLFRIGEPRRFRDGATWDPDTRTYQGSIETPASRTSATSRPTQPPASRRRARCDRAPQGDAGDGGDEAGDEGRQQPGHPCWPAEYGSAGRRADGRHRRGGARHESRQGLWTGTGPWNRPGTPRAAPRWDGVRHRPTNEESAALPLAGAAGRRSACRCHPPVCAPHRTASRSAYSSRVRRMSARAT